MTAEIILFIIAAGVSYYFLVHKSNITGSIFSPNISAKPITVETKVEKLKEVAGRYYDEKNFLAAEKAYLKLLKIDHKNIKAYSRLGFIYNHFGNSADAVECFEIVARAKPSATSYHNLAMALFKNREFAKSAAALEKSLQREENLSRLISLARIYRIMSKYDRQIEVLQKAQSMSPQDAEILLLLADAYLHAKDTSKAEQTFAQVLRIDPNNARARQALGKK